MRIAFLWTGLSGYINACLKELSCRSHVELFVIHEVPTDNAPFEDSQFQWITDRFAWRSSVDGEQLEGMMREFGPHIMVLPSWHVRGYRYVARRFANKSWRVMVMDNPWRASLKQRLGSIISPIYVRPIADVVWLPGERQATFARRLGFSQREILRGSFSCDHVAFAAMHEARVARKSALPRSFVFIGRMVPTKCVDVLVASYNAYRNRTPAPWPLICCGSGPLRSLLENQEGITVNGFVQPEEVPAVLGSVGCLIIPSSFEPWSLVVHEAASAGRLILASECVGAVPHLVQSGYNGFIFNSRDIVGLTNLMLRVSDMTDEQLNEMSVASYQLSKQFSPRRWADTLLLSYEARSNLSVSSSGIESENSQELTSDQI
jgi:glycosyltransferase involved in cell wall biosynthesis